ncbi:MAG: penicillin-binding protein 1A [Gammaproteobacteria bacterium]|nr:penicillin-binding protein 1A [Gammaproteobacteria bacterium]
MFVKAHKRHGAARVISIALSTFSNLFMMALAVVVIVVMLLVPGLPDIETIKTLQLKVPLRIYSSDGLLLGEFGDQRRIPIKIADTPPALIAAVLSAEDDRYYQHAGVDYRGVLRAMYANFVSGSRAQGASTITMQVARNYYLTKERTYLRKAREALLALRLEQYLTKDEILELYLNKIFLGHRAYGFGAAANVYYGKPLGELEIPQYAMLAALPKAPSSVNPLSNPNDAKTRRDYILGRMRDLGFISLTEFSDYVESSLTAELHISEVELKAPYVAEQIRREMFDRFGEAAYEDGYSVYSTIISTNQLAASQSLREGLIQYDRRHGFRGPIRNWDLDQLGTAEQIYDVLRHIEPSQDIIPVIITEVHEDHVTAVDKFFETISIPWENMQWARRYQSARLLGPKPQTPSDVLDLGDIVFVRLVEDTGWTLVQIPDVNGAIISIDPKNGAVLAMVGGFDYYLDKFNRATQGKRLMGSSIKPFVYSAAIDNGFTSASLISGAPIVVEDQQSEILWRPQNYSGKFTGETRLREALARSLNLVSVRLIRGLGIDTTINHITKFGFDRTSLPIGFSLALGSAEETPLNVVTGFAVFANGGHVVEPYYIDIVKDQHDMVVLRGKTTEVCSGCLFQLDSENENLESLSQTPVKRAERVISSANAYIMTDLLRGVVREGTGRRALSLNRADLAGKTGTTNDFEDAWFSGFNADIATTVWVGFDKPADLGRNEHGSGLALPIWIDYMKTALENVPESPLEPPDNIVTQFIDVNTGEAVPEDSSDALQETFIAGTQPLLDIAHVSLNPEASQQPDAAEESAESQLF